MVHIAVANAKDEVVLGRAAVTRTAFRQFVTVTIDIEADASRVWALLTDAAGFPRWNSTVAGIDGRIALGETLAVRVPGTAQVFKPTVTEFEPLQRMVWRGGFLPLFQGIRVFELLTIAPRRTRFTPRRPRLDCFARGEDLALPCVVGTHCRRLTAPDRLAMV